MPDARDSTLIDQASAPFGLTIDANARSQITAYFDLLLRWNTRINLTGAAMMTDLLRDHLPDSLALAVLVQPGRRLVDVGSGGGLPALPFAILRPDVQLTLVEPRAKRVAFLRAACRELRLPITVMAARMEDVTTRFDAACSMATFAPAEWLGRAPSLLEKEGTIVAFLREIGDLPPTSTPLRIVDYSMPQRPRVAALFPALPPA